MLSPVLLLKVNGIPIPPDRSVVRLKQSRDGITLIVDVGVEDYCILRHDFCRIKTAQKIEFSLPHGESFTVSAYPAVLPYPFDESRIVYTFEWRIVSQLNESAA